VNAKPTIKREQLFEFFLSTQIIKERASSVSIVGLGSERIKKCRPPVISLLTFFVIKESKLDSVRSTRQKRLKNMF